MFGTHAPFVLYAPNVHQGGGRTLLLSVLDVLKERKNILAILDDRLQLPPHFDFSGKVIRVRPTLASRMLFEYRLRRQVGAGTRILCMGNLPPLWTKGVDLIVFVQNRYLIDDVRLKGFHLLVRLRIQVERLWLHSCAKKVRRFIVQSPTMKNLLRKALGRNADILPFAVLPRVENPNGFIFEKEYDFLYVASGEPHKNHRALVEAWTVLAKQGQYPSLCLTLDRGRFPKLYEWIVSMVDRFNLHVTLTGEVPFSEIQNLYRASRALIYPSMFESFGLPLLEAAAVGLPIAAADMDYVHDVIKPTAVFDPCSPESIADSVMNFSGSPARIIVKLLDAEAFLMRVFGD